jgi:hypothetical protein
LQDPKYPEEAAGEPRDDDSIDRLALAADDISPEEQPVSLLRLGAARTESCSSVGARSSPSPRSVGAVSPRLMSPTRSSRARDLSLERNGDDHLESGAKQPAAGPALSKAERRAAQQRLFSAESASKRQGVPTPDGHPQTPTRPKARASRLKHLATPTERTVESDATEPSSPAIPRSERLKAQQRLANPPPLFRRSPSPSPPNQNRAVASIARCDR